jgi:methylmalonyl-CoA mutase
MAADLPLDTFAPTSREAWEARITNDLKGRDRERALVWKLPEGVRMEPYHRLGDLSGLAHAEVGIAFSAPGDAPNGWQRKQRASGASPEDANAAALASLRDGATAVAFDVDGLAQGDFGEGDYDALLDGIDLSAAAVHASDGGLPLLRVLLGRAGDAELTGSLEDDPIAALCRTGQLDPDRAYAALTEAASLASEHAPRFRTVCADTRPYRDAGADLVQEAALATAALAEHLAQLSERGVSPAVAASQAHVVTPVGTRFLPELAKLRALRILAAQVFEAFGAGDAPPLFVQAVAAQRSLTLADAHTNLLRGTTAAAAAVLAGCDTLEVTPYDALVGESQRGRRLARTTQLLLAHESYLDRVADPAGGAYSVEMLTDEIARAAWSLFQEIEAEGGLLEALQKGTVQERIAQAREAEAKALRTRRSTLVGVSDFPLAGETLPEEKAAAPGGIGVTGAPVVIAPLPKRRPSEPFENLRRRAEEIAGERSRSLTAYCIPVGTPAIRAARATFAQNFLGVAGIAVEAPTGFESVEAGAEAAKASGADFAVLCAPDGDLPEAFPALKAALGDSGVRLIVAAPPEALEGSDAQPDAFVHRKADLVATLSALLDDLA